VAEARRVLAEMSRAVREHKEVLAGALALEYQARKRLESAIRRETVRHQRERNEARRLAEEAEMRQFVGRPRPARSMTAILMGDPPPGRTPWAGHG
jgi:hypothetical protein